MDSDLYLAIEKIYGWPSTAEEWVYYVTIFSRWIPQQSEHEGWQDPKTGHSQEVYDNLCHFYFLLDQNVGPEGNTIVQNSDGFKEWIVSFANLWGDFLNTTESFNEHILETFENFSPYYRIQDSMVDGKPNNPSGWLTFNQFFARELNPGLRPIDTPADNNVVVAPADCTYRKRYDIDENSNITNTIFKKTHIIGNIADLLEGSSHANAFANGTFVHYFLGPFSYHRFHAPVSGMVNECRPVKGLAYLDVNLGDNGQYDAPDDSDSPAPPETGYQFNQARGIITIDTCGDVNGDVGIVGIVPIGMCQVSGVHMTATPNRRIAKGEEFGYFLFGGSDIILLFQEGQEPEVNNCETYRYYGTSISGCPDSIK
ncbi:MAG: phosphatidylserine decarboxylase [Flavobacteriaceae bacterium]|nr:MAG: phosphatidylserine decarboxylase [Flavobacteriaceae bacterium]